MNSILIRGHSNAVEAINWLISKEWEYVVQLVAGSPFAAIYEITLTDQEHAFLFKLKWGQG